MKITHPIFLSAFTELICNKLSTAIALVFLSVNILPAHGQSKASIEKGNAFTIPLYSVDNQTSYLNDSSSSFVVLKNNRNCLDCFKSINRFVTELKKNGGIRFVAVTLVDSTTLDRKRSFANSQKLFSAFDGFLYQYYKSATKNLFEELGTEYTPEIILISKGNFLRIPYKEIFQYPSLDLSIQTQIQIQKFFHID